MGKSTNENNLQNTEQSITIQKRTKVIFLIIILLVIFIALIPIGYALFSDRDRGTLNITVGKVEATLTEEPSWQESTDEYGLEKYTKKLYATAVDGSEPTYVRVKIIPVVQYYQSTKNNETNPSPTVTGEWITAAVPQQDILVTTEGEDWIKSGDYIYYTKKINGKEAANKETTELEVKWQILELASNIATKEHIRTDVRVVLEYSQAENDMWKTVFGIDELPF